MDQLATNFLQIISRVEKLTGNHIKVLVFDFDCTLTSVHSGGSFPIYSSDGSPCPAQINKLFCYPEFIKCLFPFLIERNYIIGIASHSDVRHSRPELNRIGGMELITTVLNHLLERKIFDHNNVVAYSNISDGTLGNKKTHISALLRNLNQNKEGDVYQLENVLLFDDSLPNIKETHGFHGLHTRFPETGLSFSSPLKSLPIFINILNKQIDFQMKEKYGIHFMETPLSVSQEIKVN